MRACARTLRRSEAAVSSRVTSHTMRRRPKEVTKDQKHKAPVGESLGSIYRSSKQANVLTTANADDFFMGSLRSAPMQSAAEYQRNRRAKLNLPQYKELTPAEISKAKRVWDSIDLDNSGTIDVEELKSSSSRWDIGQRTKMCKS